MSLVVTHNAGFFSCTSVKLFYIIDYFNINKILPNNIDSSSQFNWYKINKSGDITFDYFEHYNNIHIDISYINSIKNDSWDYQFTDYTKLDFNNICPFIKKYFSPSIEIKTIIKNMEEKYNIDYSNICVLFYRGNDKNTETTICAYDEYIDKANYLFNKNNNIKFLIQSDETEFINLFTSLFPKQSFYFNDEIRHMNKCMSTVDIKMSHLNYIYSKYYLAITIIMSKCNYIVCGSGNCSVWILFYRENSKNIYQNFNNKWIISENTI